MAYVMFATKTVPLDPSYKNAARFQVSASPTTGNNTIPGVRDTFMTTYFRNYADTASIYKVYTSYNEVNFDYGDGINCVLNFDLSKLLASPQTEYDKMLSLALNSNYIHMRPTATAGGNEDRFYFIRSARQMNANVVQFALELDLFTTYPQMRVNDGMFVERAHADRFVGKGSNRFIFGQEVLVSDDLDSAFDASIPVVRKTYNVSYVNTGQENATQINNALNNTAWVYFWYAEHPQGLPSFGSRLRIIETLPSNFANFLGQNINETGHNYGMYCFAVPMVAIECAITISSVLTTTLWELGDAYDVRFGATPLMGITISPFAPFTRFGNGGNLYSKMTWNATTGRININLDAATQTTATSGQWRNWSDVPETFFFRSALSSDNFYWFAMLRYKLRGEQMVMSSDLDFTSELTGFNMPYLTTAPAATKTRDITWEPKLFTQPYRKLALKSIWSQEPTVFSYTGFDTRTVGLRVVVAPNPTQEKIDAFLQSTELLWTPSSNIYANQFVNRMNHQGQNIYNMPIGQDPWKEFMSQRAASAVITIGGAAIGSFIPGAGLFSAAAAINEVRNIVQAGASPDSARVSGNDISQDYMINNTLRPFTTDLRLASQDQNKVWDYFFNYGYQVNQTRTYNETAGTGIFRRWRFNYVKANDLTLADRIVTNDSRILSHAARTKVQDVLNSGITFWNYYGPSTSNPRQTTITLWNAEIHDRLQYENLERVFTSTNYPQ